MKPEKIRKMTVVYFAIAAVLAVTTISMAAYTSLSNVKRVVTVKGTEQLFTSNMLIPYNGQDGNLQTRILSFAEGTENFMVNLQIANHIQGDTTKYDTVPIHYTLAVEVTDQSGNRISDMSIVEKFRIDGAYFTENPMNLTDTLHGGAANENTYAIQIPTEYFGIYKLKITAVPKGSKYSPIGRIITASKEVSTTYWVGNFMTTEQTAMVTEKDKLGVINYRITGQIEEDCVLSWKSEYVTVDPWFLEDMGLSQGDIVTDPDTKICSLHLHLGAEGTPNVYQITFYRTLSVNDLEEDWSRISDPNTGYITFKNSITSN